MYIIIIIIIVIINNIINLKTKIMAFKASFKFSSGAGANQELDVLNCNVTFMRDTDKKGRPSSDIYGGKIVVIVESTPDSIVLENMFAQFKPIGGSIIFKKADEDAKMKELTFENGYIVDYEEGLNVSNDTPMAIRFVISAQKVSLGNAKFEQNWPEAN